MVDAVVFRLSVVFARFAVVVARFAVVVSRFDVVVTRIDVAVARLASQRGTSSPFWICCSLFVSLFRSWRLECLPPVAFFQPEEVAFLEPFRVALIQFCCP